MKRLVDFDPVRVPYALKRVPQHSLACLVPSAGDRAAGDVALARVTAVGKNTRLELASGRLASLYPGDLLAVVFGNRYATAQFEGYVGIDGVRCDLLSAGGLCGLVTSKASGVPDPTRLEMLGLIADETAKPIKLSDFAIEHQATKLPTTIVVCGSAMDSGKSFTAKSVVRGLAHGGHSVAGIKLTGTAAGRDTWSFLDAGARPALDFVDGGHGSTFLCSFEELMSLHRRLLGYAADSGAAYAVIEIADGLFQRETTMLLQSREFRATVDHWLFATGDPLAAHSGIGVLAQWGIKPEAISGLISSRPLALAEAREATQTEVYTAEELQRGILNHRFAGRPRMEVVESREVA